MASKFSQIKIQTTSGSKFSSNKIKPVTKKTGMISGTEYLESIAKEAGLEKQAEKIISKRKKLTTFERLSHGLGAFNPAEALLTGIEKKSAFLGSLEYGKNVIQGIGSAITGRNYEEKRRSFKDVAEEAGIENKILKGGIGFIGDVLLDPSTYFGGAIARGVTTGAKVAAKTGLKGIAKVSPEIATGLEMTGAGLKDVLGRAFEYGYKASKGAKEDIAKFLGKKLAAQFGLAASNMDRLGVGALTKDQQQELAARMVAGKRAEFELGEKTSEQAIKTVNELFPDIKVKDPQHAEYILNNLENTTQKNIEDIRKNVDEIVKPYFNARQKAIKSGKILESKIGLQETPSFGSFKKIDELNTIVDGLKNQLSKLRKLRKPIGSISDETIDTLGGKITKDEAVQAYNSLIRYEEERLIETIDSLSNKIENVKSKPSLDSQITDNVKKEKLSPAETIIFAERKIKQLQNDLAEKSRLLGVATTGRITATKMIQNAVETGDWSKIEKISPEIASILKSKPTDPTVAKALQAQLERSKKFAQQVGFENPYENYFPFIRKDKLDPFLKQVQSQNIKVGSEGYRKEFKNLLTNENIELDPAKAFFTREAQQVADRQSRNFLNGFVKKYGKSINEFKNIDEARNAGYDILREKGNFGKEIGYINKHDANLIKDSLSPEFQTVSMLAKGTGFDALTSLWKRSITGLFLPFHVRNYVSGMIQNFEGLGIAALNPKMISAGQKLAYNIGKGVKNIPGIIEIGGKKVKMNKVYNAFKDRFGSDTFYTNDFIQAINKGKQLKQALPTFSGERLKETAKTLGLGQEAIPFKIGRTIGQFIEHQQKATAYLTALSKGINIDGALKMAEKVGFDYGSLTRFESQILRRLIPFYSFTRKNIELQLKTLGENPQRINQIMSVFENIGQTPSTEEKKNLPDYIRESFGIKLKDTPEGLKQYISSFGTPIEAFTQLFGKNPILRGLSMTNPILKAPIEIGIGKDSFRQRDLKDVYDARDYSAAPQIIKDLLDIKEVTKPILKKNEKTGKLEKIGERQQYVADPVKLLIARSLFTSRGISYLDQAFDGDLKGFVKAMKLVTGFKPTQIDIEQTQSIEEKNKERELEDLLQRYGEVSKFQKVFIPKEKQIKSKFSK